ncbi:hypothetical protein P7K49_030968 [Saguinus oedipus]|uniref:Uncharacterized protein n=1 Tax=Saguinus oedipus TaxID=9490 RepID=A0ABQ9U3P0_SAGOE|nr:hypothetical protein P7K49_030968 [Saguinus oedipus]
MLVTGGADKSCKNRTPQAPARTQPSHNGVFRDLLLFFRCSCCRHPLGLVALHWEALLDASCLRVAA